MEKKRKMLLVAFFLIALSIPLIFVATDYFTTIQNEEEQVPPTFSWEYFDSQGNQIYDIENAVLSGTVKFQATLTNSPSPAVDRVVLRIYKQNGLLFDTYYFTFGTGNKYTLSLDTTKIPDGTYDFDFSFIPFRQDGTETYSSILSFSVDMQSGTGNTSENEINNTLIMYLSLFSIAAVIIAAVILYYRR